MAQFGCGLDVGTAFIVASRKTPDGVQSVKIRDAFLDLEPDARGMLSMSKISYFEKDKSIIVVGEEAISLANLFKREARRPLSKGIISPNEIDAQEILFKLIEGVMGKPACPGEVCCFSVPGNPIDMDRDVIYHQSVFGNILLNLGFTPVAVNEAYAIVLSECFDYDFTGLTFSWGAGMVNCCLSYRTIPILSFSIGRGGDWIDENSAKAINRTAASICMIKEKDNFNLLTPKSREEEVLSVYYKSLIKYAIDSVSKEFKRVQGGSTMNEPVPVILTGGTSLAKGFVDLVRIAFEEDIGNFPFPVKEIIHSKDPLYSVSKGLMIKALRESEGGKSK